MNTMEIARSAGVQTWTPVESAAPALQVKWARHADEVKAAQRLRYEVFAQEMGATLQTMPGCATGLDVDEFDAYCEHLLVLAPQADDAAPRVVGTYRVMLPDAIRRMGRCYSETEFELSPLAHLRPHMAELGRSCIAPDWRSGAVLLMLWSHLIRFLANNGAKCAIGCASIPMHDGGVNAAGVWNELRDHHMAPAALQVKAHHPLPVHLLPTSGHATLPPLVKGYLRIGAQLLGAPAWDADFGTADLPMMLTFADMPAAYRKRFLDH